MVFRKPAPCMYNVVCCQQIGQPSISIMMTSSNENIFRVTGHLRGNHQSPLTSPHKGQWHGPLTFSLICVWINDWVNNREAGDLRRYRTHYDVTVMHDRKSNSQGEASRVCHTYLQRKKYTHVTFITRFVMILWTQHVLIKYNICIRSVKIMYMENKVKF